MDNSQVGSLWVRWGKEASKSNTVVGPPDRNKEVDRPSLNSSGSHARVPTGDFNLPDISWKRNMVGCKQVRRFLECVRENFFREVLDGPVRGHTQQDLLLIAMEGLVGGAVTIGMTASGYHETAKT